MGLSSQLVQGRRGMRMELGSTKVEIDGAGGGDACKPSSDDALVRKAGTALAASR